MLRPPTILAFGRLALEFTFGVFVIVVVAALLGAASLSPSN
jgi:hypothetical protein